MIRTIPHCHDCKGKGWTPSTDPSMPAKPCRCGPAKEVLRTTNSMTLALLKYDGWDGSLEQFADVINAAAKLKSSALIRRLIKHGEGVPRTQSTFSTQCRS